MIKSEKTQDPNKHKKRFWDLFRIILAIALLYVVLSQTSLTQIVDTFQGLKLIWLFVYLVIFYISIWLMSQRYWLLLEKKIPSRDTFRLVSWQTMVGNLLATSAGAVYVVTELKGKHQVQISRSLITIVLARVWDFFSYLIGLCVASWILWNEISPLHILLYFFYLFLAVVVVVLIFFRPFLKWVYQTLKQSRFVQYRIFETLSSQILRILEYLGEGRKRYLWLLMMYSILLSGLMICAVFVSYRMFSIDISIWQIMFVVMLQQLVKIVPIQVFGGLGVFDLADLYLYGLFGIPSAVLAGVIVGKRIIFYIINITLFVTFPIPTLNKSKEQGDSYEERT